jgi:alkyl sulfatase BDS1-like metallo-beta-lactamase superfamily hydrolase
MPGVLPVDPELEPEEVARRQIRLMRAGVLGAPNGQPESSPEVQRLTFDVVARAARAEAVDGGRLTIQWRFSDADPWHLRIENGTSVAEPGIAPEADLTLETSWSDWVGVATQGEDPRRLLLRRRLRPRGSLRQLARMQRVFPPRPKRLA